MEVFLWQKEASLYLGSVWYLQIVWNVCLGQYRMGWRSDLHFNQCHEWHTFMLFFLHVPWLKLWGYALCLWSWSCMEQAEHDHFGIAWSTLFKQYSGPTKWLILVIVIAGQVAKYECQCQWVGIIKGAWKATGPYATSWYVDFDGWCIGHWSIGNHGTCRCKRRWCRHILWSQITWA